MNVNGRTLTRGIDIFSGDDPLDVGRLPDDVRFVIVKSDGGKNYNNPNYRRDVQLITSSGRVSSAYHFAHEQGGWGDGHTEFAHMHAAIGDKISGLLPPSQDDEMSGLSAQWARDFDDDCVNTYGVHNIIYGNFYDLTDILDGDSRFKVCPLWIADYTYDPARPPRVPAPWGDGSRSYDGWTFWQYSDKGPTSGVALGDTDHDVFNGTEDQLRALCVGYVAPPEPGHLEEEMILVRAKGTSQAYITNGSVLLPVAPDSDDAGDGRVALAELLGISIEAARKLPVRELAADHFIFKLPKVA